ncbi:hypothetical protein U1Q18_039188, partial [Sarracenia purpurea var. burkii]
KLGVGWEKCDVTGSRVWIRSSKKWRGRGVGQCRWRVGGWCNVTSGILVSCSVDKGYFGVEGGHYGGGKGSRMGNFIMRCKAMVSQWPNGT